MNLMEALAAKAKEQDIRNFAAKPNRKKPPGRPVHATNEEIIEAWKAGHSRYAIAKRLCRCSKRRVSRIVEEYEAGKVEA